MTARLKMSGWLPAEVAERLSDVRNVEPERFEEENEEHLHDLVPARLVKPLAALMLTRRGIVLADGIGALHNDKALTELRKDTEAVYEALKMLWSEA